MLLIIYVLFFSSKTASYIVTGYSIIFFTVLYIAKRNSQEFTPAFYIVSLITMILLFLLSRVHLSIMEDYIKAISKQSDSLEKEVVDRTRELRVSKEYAQLLFRDSPCAIYSVDKEYRIVDFNKKAEEITGYTKEEVIGRELNLFTEDLLIDEKVSREYRIRAKNDIEKVIERYNALLKDKDGSIIGEIETFIDITNWKDLEEFKTDIERIIRHDLKTPLNSIIGFPKMMLTDDSLSDEYKEYLMIILSAGQNMLNLINASLNMYKIEEGSYQYNLVETNVIFILKQISTELREIRIRKKCTIEIQINGKQAGPESILNIKTEKSLFYMILTNIIKNALEASPKGEIVLIDIIDRENLIISVHNKGVIPEDIRDRFFEKYVTSGKKHGNGLGTYSAKLMSNAIEADLYFESDDQNGTTVYLTI